MNGVSWLRNGTAEVITYTGITTVEDDMVVLNKGATAAPSQAEMTDVYQWGYADVRVNGSQYGTIVNNPYADAPSAVGGGDGFDLSWAVKADGTPIALSSVRYVRVYSAVLFSAGVFGETSTEVCGLYVANAESSSVGTTAAPTSISVKGESVETTNGGMKTITGLKVNNCTINVSATGNIYINGVATSSASVKLTPAGTKVQIVVQNGEAAPYITWLNLKK